MALCLLWFALSPIKVINFRDNSISNQEEFLFCIWLMKRFKIPFTFGEVWCYHIRTSETMGVFISLCHFLYQVGSPNICYMNIYHCCKFWCTLLFPHMHSSFILLFRLSLTFTLSCIRISIAACFVLLCSDTQFLGHSSPEMYFLGTEDNQMLFLNPWASLHLVIGALKSYGLYFLLREVCFFLWFAGDCYCWVHYGQFFFSSDKVYELCWTILLDTNNSFSVFIDSSRALMKCNISCTVLFFYYVGVGYTWGISSLGSFCIPLCLDLYILLSLPCINHYLNCTGWSQLSLDPCCFSTTVYPEITPSSQLPLSLVSIMALVEAILCDF